jgi:hypothetical protein
LRNLATGENPRGKVSREKALIEHFSEVQDKTDCSFEKVKEMQNYLSQKDDMDKHFFAQAMKILHE